MSVSCQKADTVCTIVSLFPYENADPVYLYIRGGGNGLLELVIVSEDQGPRGIEIKSPDRAKGRHTCRKYVANIQSSKVNRGL